MILKEEILVRHAREQPDKTAIVFEDKRFTFKELNDRANSLTQALMDLGVVKGDKIAVVADNCHQYLEIGCAALEGGMVLVPLNPNLSQRELSHLINNSEANTVIFGENYIDKFDTLRSELGNIGNFIAIGTSPEGAKSYEGLVASYSGREPYVQVKDSDFYMLGLTGGTTGLPKQVMLTYKNMLVYIFNWAHLFSMRQEDVYLVVMPFFYGQMVWQVFSHLYMGCTSVILKESTPSSFLKAVDEEEVTNSFLGTSLVPALTNSSDISRYDHSSLRHITVAGAPLPARAWKQAIEAFGSIFTPVYASVEFSPVTFLPPEELVFEGPKAKGGSCGKEALSAEIRIVDEEGNDMPPRQVGEVIAKGKSMMAGYWKGPKATQEVMGEGYFYTGDLGMLDDEGYLYLIGRKKDVITSQGKLISPSGVEDIICRHPSVLEAAVVGVPDERLGEAVKAVIVLKSGPKVTTGDIITLCRDYLPPHAVPSLVDFVASLPKSIVGKILKRELK